MRKELLKQIGIICVVGVGAGICGSLVARRGLKQAREEIKEIHEKTADDKMENLEARLNRLERTSAINKYDNTYWLVAGFIAALYLAGELDSKFRHIQEIHNGLVKHVANTFGVIGNVCEDLDNRIGAMEVK